MRLWTVLTGGTAGRAAIGRRANGPALAGLLIVSGLVTSANTPVRRAENVKAGCVGRFDPDTDYFPDKAVIEDAANFRVEYRQVLQARDRHASRLPAGPPKPTCSCSAARLRRSSLAR